MWGATGSRKKKLCNSAVAGVEFWSSSYAAFIRRIQAGPAKTPIIRQSGISYERQWPTANWAYPRDQLDTVVILSPPAWESAKLVPKKVVATHVSWFEHFFHVFFVLLFLKLLKIQRGWNWLNFSGHVHLGTRSRDICVSFHGSLLVESYGRIPEMM